MVTIKAHLLAQNGSKCEKAFEVMAHGKTSTYSFHLCEHLSLYNNNNNSKTDL